MHIARAWTGDLDVDIVALFSACVPRLDDCKSRVDAADKRGFRRLARIDQPAFLVVAIGGGRAIPASVQTRVPGGQPVEVRLRAFERLSVSAARGVGAPENHPDVDAPLRCGVEHIEQRAAAVRHLKMLRHEGDGEPDTVLGVFYCVADAAKRGAAVDQRTNPVTGPSRIGTLRDERDGCLAGLVVCGRLGVVIH